MTNIVHGQVLPDAEAATLRDLRATAYSHPPTSQERRLAQRRVAGYIGLLRAAGWTNAAIGSALGISWQAVQQTAAKYESALTGLPDVAMPPERERPSVPSPWSPPLPDDIREQLSSLRRASEGLRGRIRGTAREQSPAARASAEFAAIVDHLISEQGYTAYRIAVDLDVTMRAITSRLEMWGYRPHPPSAVPAYLREATA